MGPLHGKEGCHGNLWQHKKKIIRDKLILLQFFDLGINEEGYWNYFHMALQIEDIFDVLSTKFPHHDFFILMDQSSGHGKEMEGGLNAMEMGIKVGGSKKNVEHNNLTLPKCW